MSLSPENIIKEVNRLIQSDKRSEIRLNANGGNSILLVCPPEQEYEFIQVLETKLEGGVYAFIDLNQLLISFVEKNNDQLQDYFELLKGSVHQIFKAPEGEIAPDFFKYILSSVQQSFFENKILVLINVGALYGTGIENIRLMESELVMKSNKPLVILYPATQDGDQLMFLNSRPASRYRCMIVN
jgi:hypothetical protein